MLDTTEKTSFQKICHSISTIINVLSRSILCWTLALIGCIVLEFTFLPFLTSGCVFIAFILLFIYCIIGYNLYDTDEWAICIVLFILALIITLMYISLASGKDSNTATIKLTEYYEPVNVIKNESQLVLVGNFHTVVSDSLRLYTSKYSYICKDERYNGFNARVTDKWYLCIK